MLFHEKSLSGGVGLNNATLRKLDLSWRCEKWNVNEVIVVGRLAPVKGDVEDILTKDGSSSPTQLWLKELPKPDKKRPAIVGKIRQETYVRLIIPVRPTGK
jgi:hypothetical protein